MYSLFIYYGNLIVKMGRVNLNPEYTVFNFKLIPLKAKR